MYGWQYNHSWIIDDKEYIDKSDCLFYNLVNPSNRKTLGTDHLT